MITLISVCLCAPTFHRLPLSNQFRTTATDSTEHSVCHFQCALLVCLFYCFGFGLLFVSFVWQEFFSLCACYEYDFLNVGGVILACVHKNDIICLLLLQSKCVKQNNVHHNIQLKCATISFKYVS